MGWVAVPLLVATLACAEVDDTALEPLSGLSGQAPAQTLGQDPAVLGAEVGLGDLPGDMYDDPPPGFGERPLEELDLPPDEPPPPVESGAAPPPVPPPAAPAPSPTAPPRNPPPPPAARPSGLDPTTLAAIGDYCTLFGQNGGILAMAEDAMVDGPPARVPEVLTFAEAVFRRGAELGPTNLRASHDHLAGAMAAYRDVLARYGNRFEQVVASGAGAQELSAIETPQLGAAVEAVEAHVASGCGVSIL